MKCPRCELITSNNKNECPRCGQDFRSKKENLQLSYIAAEADPTPKAKSSFSDLIVAVDRIVNKHKSKVKYDPFIKPIIVNPPNLDLRLDFPEINEIEIPEIKLEPEQIKSAPQQIRLNPQLKSSTGLQALMDITNGLIEINKSSSTNLKALAELTAGIPIKAPIVVPEREWKTCEMEMVKLSIDYSDQGFFEVIDLQNDKEIPVLFELAEREIINPSSIRAGREALVKKSKIFTELDAAVETFEKAQVKVDARKKLNIMDSGSISLITCDFISPASLWHRFFCFVIDSALTLIATLSYIWLRVLPESITTNILLFDKQMAFEMLPYLADVAMYYYIFWMVSQCLMLATWGSTIGGKVFGIAVTDSIGFLLTFRHSFLRSLSWSVTILSAGLGVFTVFFNHRQTLHDRVARTIVVKLSS